MTVVCQMALAAGDIDNLRIDLPDGFQLITKAVVGLVLFGIALGTRPADFRDVARRPAVVLVAIVAQYAIAPGLALLLTLALDVRGSVAIGMLLVASCPAGNLSNLLTFRARGDVALSISLTGVSNVLAVVVTPVAFAFWCGLNPAAADLLRDISIDPWQVVREVVLLIGLPFIAGLFVGWRWPGFALRAGRFVEPGALVLMLLIVSGALAGQLDLLVSYVGVVAVPIIAHNAIALGLGYLTGRVSRLDRPGVTTMTFELGVRNTALGLVLALTFFEELGGVVLVTGLWGLWDTMTGLALATWWRRALAPASVESEADRRTDPAADGLG